MNNTNNRFKVNPSIKLNVKYLSKFGITVEKRVHTGWDEHQAIRKSDKPYAKDLMKTRPLGYFYKWQYIFTSTKGRISLIRLFDYYRIGEHLWEIYCLDEMKKWKNEVGEEIDVPSTPAKKELEDIRRFYKREDAVKCITEILRIDK